jgi:EAL domain-containing protein (putative c-di-GMP-specific phosphodiesterase class I)
MVRSINEIGHLTGKQTIAEFAENAEIIQMLTSLGVVYAQGYGVAQPQRVLKWLLPKRRMPTALTVPQRGRVW